MGRKTKWMARLPLGLLAALLLGCAVAFFCIAMPEETLERIVSTLHLPEFLPAMTPPPGDKARLLIAGSAGLTALLLVWGCFTLIGRKPRMPCDTDADYAPDFGETTDTRQYEEPPRRPLLACTELGLPFDLAGQLPKPPAPKPEMPIESDAPESGVPRHEESVAALMARLEAGLARRSEHQPAARVTPIKPSGKKSAEQPEDSLRSALQELQRMAHNAR
jgi:hypothetical protein